MNKYKIIIVVSQGNFSSTFSVVGSVNFRTRLERPLVHSVGDSEIFHVQLLKMVMKNDPGNYYNFVLVDASTKTFMYKQGAANLGNVPQAPALKRLYQKKSNLINSYIYMEKLSLKLFLRGV